jgi:hypothetical protein
MQATVAKEGNTVTKEGNKDPVTKECLGAQ